MSQEDSIQIASISNNGYFEEVGIYISTQPVDTVYLSVSAETIPELTLYDNKSYTFSGQKLGYKAGSIKVYGTASYNKPYVSFRCCATLKSID